MWVYIKCFIDSFQKNGSPSDLFQVKQCINVNVKWVKPPVDWVKINVDGACNVQTGSIGAGGLILDHNGSWMIGFVHNIGKGCPLLAEGWAAATGLELASSKGFSSVILESDSSELVNFVSMTGSLPMQHPLYNLIHCIHQLARSFSRFQVVHCYREGNS